MRKIIIALLLIVSANYIFAQQYPWPPANLGSPTTAVRDSGGFIVRGMFMPPNFADTTAANQSFGTNQYSGSLIFTTSDSSYWARNPTLTKWIQVGSGSGGGSSFSDTVFVRFPLGVDTTTIPGRQIIFIRSPNGLVYGGVVTLDSCLILSITPAIYNLNYIQYTSLLTSDTVETPDPSLPRIDLVVADTNALVYIITGTPAATPLPPYVNPSYQIVLTTINVPAGVSCLEGVTRETIYDEHLLVAGGEWDTDTSGTINVDYDNPDNPYHLDTAAFVSTYTDQSRQIFTKTGSQDTVVQGEIFKGWLYLNNELLNQIQMQWYLNDTTVTNNMVINTYLNPLDSNEYQNVSIPMEDFTWSRNYFNKLVISYAGDDTSGAKGLYWDWLQLIKGIDNGGKRYVDSTKIIAGFEYYYINGISYLAGAVSGGSGGGSGLNIYNSDSTLAADRTVNGGTHNFVMNSLASGDFIAGDNTFAGATGELYVTAGNAQVNGQTDAANASTVSVSGNGININSTNDGGTTQSNITLYPDSLQISQSNASDGTILQINRNFAKLSYTGSTENHTHFVIQSMDSLDVPSPTRIAVWDLDTLKSAAALSLTTTGTSGAATYNSGTGVLNIPQYTGGGSSLTRQIITSGSSGTVTGGNYIVTFDPSATLAAYTLTLPASPSDLDIVEVDFGGTLTSGLIVTALTISPNSGQTILDNTPPGSATADNTLFYRYRTATTQWYRFKP